jgi:hypothetical protein
LLGKLKDITNSFWPGLLYLCFSMIISATIILTLRLGHRPTKVQSGRAAQIEALPGEEPDAIIEPV